MLKHRTESVTVSIVNSLGKKQSIVIPPPPKRVIKAMNDYNNRLLTAFRESHQPKKEKVSSGTLSNLLNQNVKTKKK